MNFHTHHICIKVSNIDRAEAFYQTALGFTETARIFHTPDIVSCFMSAPDHGIQIQLLCLPDHAAEHVEYGHLGLETEDIRACFVFHEKMGCVSSEIVEQPHQFGYFIKDPDGYETEIVQMK